MCMSHYRSMTPPPLAGPLRVGSHRHAAMSPLSSIPHLRGSSSPAYTFPMAYQHLPCHWFEPLHFVLATKPCGSTWPMLERIRLAHLSFPMPECNKDEVFWASVRYISQLVGHLMSTIQAWNQDWLGSMQLLHNCSLVINPAHAISFATKVFPIRESRTQARM